jgi:signal peptidase II
VAEALTSPQAADDGLETHSQRRRRWALFLGLAAGVVILDQVSKLWVDASFEIASRSIPAGQPGGPTEIVGELVRIAKTYNDGAIFGVFEAIAPIMAVLSVLVIGAISWFEWRHGARSGWLVTIGLGLLLGGAIGNLIDRVRLGQVIDFVDMGIGGLRWYAWNVSDAAVFLGILVLLGAALLGDRAPRGDALAGPPDGNGGVGPGPGNSGPGANGAGTTGRS